VIRYYLVEEAGGEGEVAQEGNEGEEAPGRARRGGSSENEGPTVRLDILDSAGDTVRTLEGPGNAGVNEVVWDLRIGMLDDEPEGPGGGRGGTRAPKVMPGTYTVQLEVAGDTSIADIRVLGDPRIEISRVDLQARQDALLSLFELDKAVRAANTALGEVSGKVSDVWELLSDTEGVPEELIEVAETMKTDLDSLRQDLSQASRNARVSNAIEGSTTRPTADQLWQMDRAWDEVPPLIEQLNDIITHRLPALYDHLNEHGIRPDPGEAIVVPRRPVR
jgi:hypothetical protein